MSLNNILYFYSISSSVVILVTTMDTELITGMVCAFQLELFVIDPTTMHEHRVLVVMCLGEQLATRKCVRYTCVSNSTNEVPWAALAMMFS